MSFPLLVDEGAKVIASYGVDNAGARRPVPHPSIVIVGAGGDVVFKHVDPNYATRLPAERVIGLLKNLAGS